MKISSLWKFIFYPLYLIHRHRLPVPLPRPPHTEHVALQRHPDDRRGGRAGATVGPLGGGPRARQRQGGQEARRRRVDAGHSTVRCGHYCGPPITRTGYSASLDWVASHTYGEPFKPFNGVGRGEERSCARRADTAGKLNETTQNARRHKVARCAHARRTMPAGGEELHQQGGRLCGRSCSRVRSLRLCVPRHRPTVLERSRAIGACLSIPSGRRLGTERTPARGTAR